METVYVKNELMKDIKRWILLKNDRPVLYINLLAKDSNVIFILRDLPPGQSKDTAG